MYEVEVKVRADHGQVRERLTEFDADARGRIIQEDTYYDVPHRDFRETDEALRIRRETTPADETGTKLTYKGPLVDEESKTREEAETAVGDGEELASILDGLGFEPVATVRKERDRFSLDGFTVALDSVDGLGDYVEVETDATAEELDTARDGAFSILERLGLDPSDQIRTSYLGLLLARNNSWE